MKFSNSENGMKINVVPPFTPPPQHGGQAKWEGWSGFFHLNRSGDPEQNKQEGLGCIAQKQAVPGLYFPYKLEIGLLGFTAAGPGEK